MQANDIAVGMFLRLKPSRVSDYGLDYSLVRVTGFKYRNGYKTPYIQSGNDFFKPADFIRRVVSVDYAEAKQAAERAGVTL